MLLTREIWLGKKVRPDAKSLKKAELCWITKSQQNSFGPELETLENHQSIPKNSRLLELRPVLKSDGILVVEKRIGEV